MARVLTVAELEEAAKLHKAGWRVKDLARKYHVAEVYFWRRWPELGIDYKNPNVLREKHTIKSEDLLGFIKEMQATGNNGCLPDLIAFYERMTRMRI